MRRVERRPRVARARRGRVDERDCPRRHLGRLVHQPQARKRPLRQLRLQRPRRRPQRRVVVVRVVLDGPERAFALRPGGALQRQALALLRLDHRRQQQRRHVDRGAPDGVRVQRGRGQSGAEDCALERQDAADVRRRAGARRVGPRGGVDEHEDERRQRRRVRGRRPEHAPRAAACARLEAVRRLAARPQQVEHVLVEGPRVVVLLVLVLVGRRLARVVGVVGIVALVARVRRRPEVERRRLAARDGRPADGRPDEGLALRRARAPAALGEDVAHADLGRQRHRRHNLGEARRRSR
mmetsp:Transcript_27999/g.94307  ORF Transcript_27999/g.94307 Transcript_27999/m.94307 type:complete len:296 (-) Transcript_27999:427-1314(-)